MAKPRVQVDIINELWKVVHKTFKNALLNLHFIDDGNGSSNDAVAIYPLAVTAFEAYFNTNLLSTIPNFNLSPGGGELLSEHRTALARLDLPTRVLLLTRIACGRTFDQAAQPFQDFTNLVKIRNAIVHFQMQEAPLKVVEHLSTQGIALPEHMPGRPGRRITLAWVHRISTARCMMWAINTVAETTTELQRLLDWDMIVPLYGISKDFQLPRKS